VLGWWWKVREKVRSWEWSLASLTMYRHNNTVTIPLPLPPHSHASWAEESSQSEAVEVYAPKVPMVQTTS
jgi:hypothetical protein